MSQTQYIRIHGLEEDKRLLLRQDIKEVFGNQGCVGDINEGQYILAVITHTFDNTQLPLQLDCIFDEKNIGIYENSRFTIRGCINNLTRFHTKLWQGYNHLAIIEIDNPKSEIINSLKPYSIKKRWDSDFILCTFGEYESCSKELRFAREKHEEFMKKNNREWWDKLKREEEEFKKKQNTHNIN